MSRGSRGSARGAATAALLGAVLAASGGIACGKKGPPLPPLRLVPAPVSEITARRAADTVHLRFVLPTRNQNGPGRVDLERIEIYAVTIMPGGTGPANRDLLTRDNLVGTLAVRPAPEEGEEPLPTGDTRPGPGDRVTFTETLTPETLKPVAIAGGPGPPAAEPGRGGAPPVPQKPAAREGELPPAEPLAASAESYPARVYAIRGVSHGGRPGPPAGRLGVPLVAPPPSPTGVAARPTERSIMVEWQPPVTEPGGPAVSFNVYRPAGDGLALNAAPLAGETYEHPAVAMGEEQCFAVRSVILVQSVQIESELSAASCVTPRDVFPPEAPRGLQAVAAAEGIELSWNANTEADLAGYVVLRGEAPGDTLQPLTPAPIRETTYRDTSTTSGVRYVYAVIAVDTATPPNASPQSARQEVTAR